MTAVLRSGNAGYCDIDRGRKAGYCDVDRGRNRNWYLGYSLTERAATVSVAARTILALLQTTYC
jgi:hypothetical protein